jgi:tRNA(Ile)-lysidine synthase
LLHFVDAAFLPNEHDSVGVAVSGGGDSMALLHLSHRRAQLVGTRVEAVTVNHGLREDATDEAAMVAKFCADLGIAHQTLEWDGTKAMGNLAAAARDARYALISKWAKGRGIGHVLLGHTQDDVAETFLMRLARKSGVDGLALMDIWLERHDIQWARPLWQQSRADLRDYLRRNDIAWVDDPTNEDETYERPKARKALASLAPLGITPEVLKSVAMNMVGARTALDHYTVEEARRLVTFEAGDVAVQRRPRLSVPPEIERRLWVAALQYIGGSDHPPRYGAMIELDAGLVTAGKHTLAGCVVTQDATCVRFARELNEVKNEVCNLSSIWDGRWKIDGPDAPDLKVRALGDYIKDVPDWRDAGLPRTSLMATPAVYDAETLISAPVAGYKNGYDARIVADFGSFLLSR